MADIGPAQIAMAVYAVLLLLLLSSIFVLAVLWAFRGDIWDGVLSLIDSLIVGILSGQGIRRALVDLVTDILKRPRVHESIKVVVQSVLRDDEMRGEISLVVSSVLREDGLIRKDISSVVHEVLANEDLSERIGKTVGGCLNDISVSKGIVGAIKGTGMNVLSEAGELVEGTMPKTMAFARRRLGSSDTALVRAEVE